MSIVENIPFEMDRPFTREEYAQRQQRLVQLMDRHGIDACMLFTLHSLYYLYGYFIIPGAIVFQTVLVRRGRPPVGIVRGPDGPILKHTGFFEEIDLAVGNRDDAVELALHRLKGAGLRRGSVLGMELMSQSLYSAHYERLRRWCEEQGVHIRDFSNELLDLRLKKSPAEIALLLQAGKYLDITFEAAFDAMRPGATEMDVNAAALYAAHKAGADENAQPLLISSGINTLLITHMPATHRKLKVGDIILMEAGASCRNYHAVGSETVICGQEPDDEMRRLYEEARATVDAARAVVGPGVCVGDVARAMMNSAPGTFSADFVREFHGGYSIGIGFPSRWHDTLMIHKDEGRKLESGMAIALFGFSRANGRYQILTVDPVVITDDGFQDLSARNRDELHVVGASG